MAEEDDAAALGDMDGDAPSAGKKGGLKGALPQLLKFVLIGVAAVIAMITIPELINKYQNMEPEKISSDFSNINSFICNGTHNFQHIKRTNFIF